MKHLTLVLALTAVLAGCTTHTETYPLGTDVTVVKKDGANVSGRLVEVKSDRIVVQSRDGLNTEVPKAQIDSLKVMTPAAEPRPSAEAAPAPAAAEPAPAATTPPAAAQAAPAPSTLAATKPASTAGTKGTPAPAKPKSAAAPSESASSPAAAATTPAAEVKEAAPAPPPAPPPPAPVFRDLTIPSGTTLAAILKTSVASDTSKVEDVVRATLKTPISVEGFELLPQGAVITGHVTKAEPSARVKGRASLAFRFNSVDMHGASEHITTEPNSYEASSTKGKDAGKIGLGAGVGAVIGGIAGGGSGAATGAAIGGGAGAATVLATKGDEVQIPEGTPVSIKLTAPLTIKVQVK